jgi:DNA-binding CsgD family transcriptional regulator
MKTPVPAADRRSFDEAAAAYHRAEFSAAAAVLDARVAVRAVDAESALLRARIFLRQGHPVDALDTLARHANRFTSARTRAKAALLTGAASSRLGDERAAKAQLKRAAALAPDDRDLALEIAYQHAAVAWIARKLDAAEEFLEVFDRLGPTGHLLLEGRVLRGAVAASRERLAEQGAILLDALREVHAMPDPAVLPWAVIASQIAYLAREMPSEALRDAANAELAAVPWTSDLAEFRFTMLRAVGWRHALEGDYFNAFRRLKAAHAAAPSDAWRVMSSCDRAYFATVLGERRWAEQELSDARELAATVPWPSLDGEERFALSILAELVAPRDAALALSYVARYRDAGRRFARTLASADDRRVTAMESYSFGVVQQALGDAVEAARLFRSAWKIYDHVGYDWRAGRTANALSIVTGQASWKERAAEKLRPYRRSWLAAEPAAPERPRLAQTDTLTPAQLAVYKLLLRGLSTAQIAAEQDRSEFTVRNHIKAIFKALGVKSRPALIARAVGTAKAPADRR